MTVMWHQKNMKARTESGRNYYRLNYW